MKFIKQPNVQIELILKNVNASVTKETQGMQSPWYESSISGNFCFNVVNDGCGIYEEKIKVYKDEIEEKNIRIKYLENSLKSQKTVRDLVAQVREENRRAKKIYTSARSLLVTDQYEQAIALFKQYLDIYPDNNYAPDATYWLAKTYLASKKYHNAKVIFRVFQKEHPLHHKYSNSLFDLAKEFTGLFDTKLIGRTFIYTVLGQFMTSKYAIVNCSNGLRIIDSKFNEYVVSEFCKRFPKETFTSPKLVLELPNSESNVIDSEIELIVPMQIKNDIKGLVLLGQTLKKGGYTNSDIEFIYSAASLAVISLENSRLFEEYLQKQKMEKDLEVARSIQQKLIPSKFPKFNNFEISAVNIPARQVGGDYFDILKLDDDRTLIVIADVSGKGIQAALLMANIQAFIKTLSKLDYKLGEATNMLNNLVTENTTNGSFITLFWGIFNDKTLEFEYVNAGHNPPYRYRNGEITRMKKGGMILGVMETIIPYESEKIYLQPNDTLLFFTDGITEAMNINNEEFGEEKLINILTKNADMNVLEMKNEILRELKVFTEDAEQSDDITLMVLKSKEHVCKTEF
jgi:sigma-B regulation protein RsbU (phosphoserine phosphatase)